MKKIRYLLILAALLSTTVQAEEAGNDEAEVARQLQALQAEIQKFKDMLEQTQGQRSSLENNLEANEKQINELLKKIEAIEKNLGDGEKKLEGLRLEESRLNSLKQAQQEQIAAQIRGAYKLGKQEHLKVVLNQEDPNRISRMMTYYDYLNRARAARVDEYRGTLQAMEAVVADIRVQTDFLTQQHDAKAAELLELQIAQADRYMTLQELNQVIAATGTELERRAQDRAQLEQLLARIRQGIEGIPGPDAAPFANQQGKLLFPVSGSITSRFGSRRTGNMKWDGVFIQAEAGKPVAAVHYGQVVFSDWLRGFGLLMIINHGSGYMSLYGHNQVLYREAGEWVSAGEVIATIGDTGGQNETGLYFEIRYDGKPTDPQNWCQARPATA